ncbi:hypothetical protein [Legionella sp. WA2024007413]
MRRDPAFKIRNLTKIYQMGEIQIHALQKNGRPELLVESTSQYIDL